MAHEHSHEHISKHMRAGTHTHEHEHGDEGTDHDCGSHTGMHSHKWTYEIEATPVSIPPASPCEQCSGAGTPLCVDCSPIADECVALMTQAQAHRQGSGHMGDDFAEARDMQRRLRKQPVCTLETKRDRTRKCTNVRHMQASVAAMGE